MRARAARAREGGAVSVYGMRWESARLPRTRPRPHREGQATAPAVSHPARHLNGHATTRPPTTNGATATGERVAVALAPTPSGAPPATLPVPEQIGPSGSGSRGYPSRPDPDDTAAVEVWSLVERAQAGDAEAFGLIYDRYFDT